MTPPRREIWVRDEKRTTEWERNKRLAAFKLLLPVVPSYLPAFPVYKPKSPPLLLKLLQVGFIAISKSMSNIHVIQAEVAPPTNIYCSPANCRAPCLTLGPLSKNVSNRDTKTSRILQSLEYKVICAGSKWLQREVW